MELEQVLSALKLDHNALRALIILAILLVSAGVNFLLPPLWTQRALLFLLGAALALLVLHYPPLGVLGLVTASLIVPFEIATGRMSNINVTILLVPCLGGLWLLGMVLRKEVRLAASPLILPLLGLCLAAFLAFLLGQLDWFPFAPHAPLSSQLGGLALYLFSVAAFLVSAHQLQSLRWLQRLTWLFLLLGGLYLLGHLVGESIRRFLPHYTYGATGSVFWIWLTVLSFGLGLYHNGLKVGWRLILLGLGGATLYVGYFQARDWTSGWLPGLLGALVVLWLGSPKWGLAVTVCAGVFALFSQSGWFEQALVLPNEYSLLSRAEAGKIMWEIIKVNPLLGLGPSNYYYYTPLFPIWGWRVSFNSHNQFVDLVAQSGLLGLAMYLWFFAELGRLVWRLRSSVSGGFARAFLFSAAGGAAGMLVCGYLGDWVIPFVYNIGFSGFRASALGWVFLGGLVVLEHETKSAG